MPIEWTPRMAVGVEIVDTQHKELFKRVNDLITAMESRGGESEVRRLLTFLGEYVFTHFDAEQRLMLLHGYPEFAKHKAIHDGFVTGLGDLKARVEKGDASAAVVVELNGRICGWLRNHVGVTDRAFGTFLASKGARPAARP
jgi:hemerythrin